MESFRYLITCITLCLAACGGGGGGSTAPALAAPLPTVTTLTPAAVTLTYSSQEAIVAAIPDGLHTQLSVSYDVTSNGFFSQNATDGQSGHFAFGTRADLAVLKTAIFGQGVVFGNVSTAPNGSPNPLFPSTQLETWFNGIEGGNSLLLANTPAPILKDGVTYRIAFTSTLGTRNTLRYTVSQGNQLLYDSGEVIDSNGYFDTTKNGIWVAHVFDTPGNWSIVFSNIVVTY